MAKGAGLGTGVDNRRRVSADIGVLRMDSGVLSLDGGFVFRQTVDLVVGDWHEAKENPGI